MNDDVEGLIQAGGLGARLGRGPKAFIELGGSTMLERAVSMLLEVLPRVIVAVRPEDCDRAACLVGADRVTLIAGGPTRWLSTRALITRAGAEWLLFHDVVHPFVSATMVADVLEAARESGAAAPALPNSDFLYDLDGHVRARVGELLAWQKPIAARRDDVQRGLALHDGGQPAGGTHDPGILEVLRAAGVRPSVVPGSVANFKLTNPDDLEVARAILAGRAEQVAL